jgi:hypothetical protein
MSRGDRGVFRCVHKLRTMPRSPPLPAQTRQNTRIPNYGCSTSRVYANILDAATNPFHIINYYGSCAAALVDNRRRMGAKLEDE